MLTKEITGDIPNVIENGENLYLGNLIAYFQILFYKSRNTHNPYHNFRHSLHVLWLCHKACRYYRAQLTPRQMRDLLVAALFHDFDHPGHPHPEEADPDRLNINIAVASLRKYLLAEDRGSLPEIEALVELTHFPYETAGREVGLLGRIPARRRPRASAQSRLAPAGRLRSCAGAGNRAHRRIAGANHVSRGALVRHALGPAVVPQKAYQGENRRSGEAGASARDRSVNRRRGNISDRASRRGTRRPRSAAFGQCVSKIAWYSCTCL
jgi:hypothetical protein